MPTMQERVAAVRQEVKAELEDLQQRSAAAVMNGAEDGQQELAADSRSLEEMLGLGDVSLVDKRLHYVQEQVKKAHGEEATRLAEYEARLRTLCQEVSRRPRRMSAVSQALAGVHSVLDERFWFNIGAVLELSGRVDKEELARTMRDRLTSSVPRLRSTFGPEPRDPGAFSFLGAPYRSYLKWLDEKHPQYCMTEVRDANWVPTELIKVWDLTDVVSKYGTVDKWVSALYTTGFASGRPPWEVHVAYDGSTDITTLVLKLHHVLCDGPSAVKLVMKLCGSEGEGSGGGKRKEELTCMQRTGRYLLGMFEFLYYSAAPITSNPPNALFPTGKAKGTKLAYRSLPSYDLELLKSLGRPYGMTVNDVVLAVLGGAVGKYCLAKGDAEIPPKFNCGFTVSMRTFGLNAPMEVWEPSIGNHFGLQFIDLKPRLTGWKDRLQAVHQSADGVKRGFEFVMGTTKLFSPSAQFAPDLQMGAYDIPGAKPVLKNWFFNDTYQRGAMILLTNVKGPDSELKLCGAKILDVTALLNMDQLVSVFSYNSRVKFCFNFDSDSIDIPLFTKCVDDTIKEASQQVKQDTRK